MPNSNISKHLFVVKEYCKIEHHWYMIWGFLQLALTAGWFSIKILLFGWMELNLQTLVSHPPSQGMHLLSWAAYPPQKYIAKCNKLTVKIAKFHKRTIHNLAAILFSNGELPNRFLLGIMHWGTTLCYDYNTPTCLDYFSRTAKGGQVCWG